ncbi:uncharacterized protein LOC115675243 [Syzygium oleosum]|uniref:uncharacterized protein LOC115675243 n=1 Tax=Syzygium oleosum TaxID=219896 RepID=UPI0011D18592|nr:uncharacterized protein LOC115675243 [Syzygium oleosum]
MFRLHRNRPAKSGERLDFKLSQLKALQVPKGWDKLFVSVISVETGKTIAKSSKAVVRNGSCQWTETLAESVLVSHDDSSKELEDCLLKLIISMGSARSGILGEATINVTNYISSSASVPISVPLKKCNYGTVLQVTIHCLTSRTKLRDDESKETNSQVNELNSNSLDGDFKSDRSGSTITENAATSSNKELRSTSRPEHLASRETSFSSSASHQSFGSAENSSHREDLSPENKLRVDRHDQSIGETSVSSLSVDGGNLINSSSQLNPPFSNSQIMGSGDQSHNNKEMLSVRISGSSKDLLEAAEDTIEELRAEAKMWERNAQKLMLDLDMVRKEFSDLSKNHKDLDMEFSAAKTERECLRKEVEQLKLLLDNSLADQTTVDDSNGQKEAVGRIQKELEEEIRFLKETNADLTLQLSRSQESNIELVSVLQELEETVEKQKLELENVAIVQSKFSDMEDLLLSNIAENKSLKTQLQQTQESEKDLLVKLQQMEKALEDEKLMMDEKVGLEKRLLEFEREYTRKLSDKEEEIANLEAKLTETLEEKHSRESADGGDEYLIKEIESLKETVQELESDCNELTEENLDLLYKLKKLNNCLYVAIDCRDGQNDKAVNEMLVANEKSNECLKMDAEDKDEEFGKDSVKDGNEERKIEEMLLLKEEEIEYLRECHTKLEALVSDLEKEKIELEENLQIMHRESEITAKCLTDVQNDFVVLSGSVDSHVSANKTLERKNSEIGQENVALSMRIAEMEAQLSYLMDKMEETQLELERSRALCESLQDEISKLNFSSKKQKTQLEKEKKEMRNRWSEAQEECAHLREERAQLQADVESLAGECYSLQELNGKLKMQNVELHEELGSCLSGCSTKVEILEENISSLLDDVAAKERTFKTEIDALLDENRKHKEQLAVGESMLNQIYAGKTVEVENLQKEIEHLTNQISEIHDERERIVSDAANEVSKLCADKAELELALHEIRSQLQRTDHELNQEIKHLTNQISEIHDERERIVSDAAEEISKLCADKAELELALRETQSELQRKDRQLNEMQEQYERKVNDLIQELSASQEDQKALEATEQRLSKLLENHKLREEKLRTNVNELELRLTVCEYDRQRLMDESTNMKAHLQNFENLRDQLLALKNELTVTKYDKEEASASLRLVSKECTDLKAEKNVLVKKISTLQELVNDLEDCRQSKVILEEKLQCTEGELMAKQAQCDEAVEVKNELNQIRREHKHYQRMTQQLEEQKDEYLRRARASEEELNTMKEEKKNQKHVNKTRNPGLSKAHMKVANSANEDSSSSKREIRRKLVAKNVRQQVVKDQPKISNARHHIEDIHINKSDAESFYDVGVDPRSKVSLLENDLVDSAVEDDSVNIPLSRLPGGHPPPDSPRKETPEGEIVMRKKFERTKSRLESELRDIRDRYLHMSLKYAEVEAQREELVMKLKASQSAKRWFS